MYNVAIPQAVDAVVLIQIPFRQGTHSPQGKLPLSTQGYAFSLTAFCISLRIHLTALKGHYLSRPPLLLVETFVTATLRFNFSFCPIPLPHTPRDVTENTIRAHLRVLGPVFWKPALTVAIRYDSRKWTLK